VFTMWRCPAVRTLMRALYATVRACDDGGHDRLPVELPPDVPNWLAVRDRLSRAACAFRGDSPHSVDIRSDAGCGSASTWGHAT
jgi:hypothetical protein